MKWKKFRDRLNKLDLLEIRREAIKIKKRLMKVNDEIFKDVAEIIRGELADPRLGAMISVVRVETTPDLLQTKIYVSVYDQNKDTNKESNKETNKEIKDEAMKALKNSAGYIRKLLAERINLRKTPEVIFVLDESLDYSEKINNLLEEVKRKEQQVNQTNESAGQS